MTAVTTPIPVKAARRSPWPLLPLALAAALALAAVHLLGGPKPMAPATLVDLLTAYNPRNIDHRMLAMLRLPRLLAVMLAGAGLGAAGYLLQSVLRNRLGEPHILGLNAGASLTMVALTAFPALAVGPSLRPLVASLGAGALFALVLGFASAGRQGLRPVTLIFCGIAFTALANALTSVILILDEGTLEELRFWLIGDGAGARMAHVAAAAPVAAAGFALALLIAPGLAALSLGDALARGLGVSATGLRVGALCAAALMCGAAVSLVGPMGFVGLVAPVLWPGLHNRPSAAALIVVALTGAALLTAADLAATGLLRPRELPTGALTGLVGAPVFLWIFARAAK
ncbi:iron ABC transporter permease [Azospirillum sp. HJ39]|uniref:FecCD family ABC transporter permease n=1 Tax=Azospirillum sp. HJ39 TaxID=3159496 RepID=UPI003556B069